MFDKHSPTGQRLDSSTPIDKQMRHGIGHHSSKADADLAAHLPDTDGSVLASDAASLKAARWAALDKARNVLKAYKGAWGRPLSPFDPDRPTHANIAKA